MPAAIFNSTLGLSPLSGRTNWLWVKTLVYFGWDWDVHWPTCPMHIVGKASLQARAIFSRRTAYSGGHWRRSRHLQQMESGVRTPPACLRHGLSADFLFRERVVCNLSIGAKTHLSCILPRDVRTETLFGNEWVFRIKPLTVKLLAGEPKANELLRTPFATNRGSNRRPCGTECSASLYHSILAGMIPHCKPVMHCQFRRVSTSMHGCCWETFFPFCLLWFSEKSPPNC